LERHGRAGLIKDLAVIPERRGEGLAWMLAEAAVREAERQGIARLYMIGIPETLRTGQNLGFDVVECTELDDALRSSETLKAAWYCKTGVCLRLDLE
jgi:GNAT superfamily N-acetyltransferase